MRHAPGKRKSETHTDNIVGITEGRICRRRRL